MLHVYIDSVLAIHRHCHLYFYSMLERCLHSPDVIRGCRFRFVRSLGEFSLGISLGAICNNYKSSW